MIPVKRTPAPKHFHTNCLKPGAAWLRKYTDKDPHEQGKWWQDYLPHLRLAFGQRCAYLGMFVTSGHVDHFLSCGHRGGAVSPHRKHAFRWKNFRYCDPSVNSRKGILDDRVLDPFLIQEGWLRVDLESFQLLKTPLLPAEFEDKAEVTLEQINGEGLNLRRDYSARLLRRHYYERYWSNKDMTALEADAPLIAAAVKERLAAGQQLPDPKAYPVDLPEPPLRKRDWAPRRPQKSIDGADEDNAS